MHLWDFEGALDMFGQLDKGFKYREIETCGQIFLTCAVFHNMMLSKMVCE